MDLRKILKRINKDENLSERQKVFQVIKSVLTESYQDVEMVSADLMNEEDPEIFFIYIDGVLTATADLAEVEGISMLILNFHVQTLANKAIRVYNLLNRYLIITVVSHSVFFPIDNKTSTKLVYNATANQKYAEKLYREMTLKVSEIQEAVKDANYAQEIH